MVMSMPRVSDAYRERRRDEIAQAAMRSMRRLGFSGSTMADIIAESGLSSGAIYANFANKAELVRFVASHVIAGRMNGVEQLVATSEAPPTPAQVIELVLSQLVTEEAPFDLIIQFWGEAASDPDMRETVLSAMDDLERMFVGAVTPWLAARDPGADTSAHASRLASVMLAMCQGFMARKALRDDLEPATYVAGLRTILAS